MSQALWQKHISDGIYTVNFIDGFAKSIQTKKTAVVNGVQARLRKWQTIFDGLYRLTKSYYPTMQNYDVTGDMVVGIMGRVLQSDTDRIGGTITRYDILRRDG